MGLKIEIICTKYTILVRLHMWHTARCPSVAHVVVVTGLVGNCIDYAKHTFHDNVTRMEMRS